MRAGVSALARTRTYWGVMVCRTVAGESSGTYHIAGPGPYRILASHMTGRQLTQAVPPSRLPVPVKYLGEGGAGKGEMLFC